ncbi:MAG TPA: YaiO family outer membrane beta-barrel protein [Burkholderiales bacterium]|nr:YaiO family outer membrane beta-barrel protein [Burkholderiales bacterium]
MKGCCALGALLAAFAAGQAAAQQAGYRVEAEAGGSLEHLSNNQADWRSAGVSLEARNAERRSYYGYLRGTDRFDLRDNEGMVGTYQPFGGSWGAQLEGTVSPTHRVLAKGSLLGALEKRFEHGWGVQAGYRRSDYETDSSYVWMGTVDRYFSDFRAAYSVYLGRPDGAGFSPSHRLQFSYYYGDHSYVGISGARGREVENVVPVGLVVSQVRSFSLAGRHEFAPGWELTYELLRHRQGDFYTRRGLALGIRHAF